MVDMYVARNKELAYRVIDDEAIVLTPEDGMIHNLNSVAARIFELADGDKKIKDIIDLICEEFGSREDVVKPDVIKFVEDLVHNKMLILSDNPIKV